MTTIVADRKNLTIYSDSQTTIGNVKLKTAKIYDRDGIVYGIACEDYNDSVRFVNWFFDGGKKPKCKTYFQLIVLYGDKRLYLYDGVSEEEILEDIFCIGSGAVHVNAILKYQKKYEKIINVKKAMTVAFSIDAYSSGPIQKNTAYLKN